MFSEMSIFRVRAAAIHLAATGVVGLSAAGLVFGLWYPWPYRVVSGGTELFLLVVGVDLVLGPLITLTIFSPKKSRNELIRDLAVVVMVQLSALGYGLFTVFESRPVVLALEGQRFRVVSAAGVQLNELDRAPPALRHLSLIGPRLINTSEPADEEQRQEAILMAMAGADLGARPSFWREWNEVARASTRKQAKPVAALLQKTCAAGGEMTSALKKSGVAIDNLRYLPLLARQSNWIVLIDAGTGEPVGFAPTRCVG